MPQEAKIVLTAEDRTRKGFRSAEKGLQKFGGRVRTTTRNASSRIDTFRRNVENMRPAFQKAAIAGGAAMAGIGAAVGNAIQEASRIKEIERLFSATFTETEQEMEQWAAEVADKFGRAEQDMMSMAATAGSVLKPAFDIAEMEIADMTQGLGEAAVALAATDTRIQSSQQAMEGFTQALIGNRQRVIDWGFQVRDAQLKQIALEKGIISAGEELTQQQEAMLTAQEIMENVSVSTQVLKDSQDDWSQISKRLRGQIKELSGTIGGIFLPVLEDLGNEIEPILKDVKNWVSDNKELTRNIIIAAGGVAALVAAVGTLGFVLPSIIGGVTALATVVAALGFPFFAAAAIVGTVAFLIINHMDQIKEFIGSAVEFIKGAFEAGWNFVLSGWRSFKANVEMILMTVKASFKAFKNFMDRDWGKALFEILGKITGRFWRWATKTVPEQVSAAINFFKEFPGKIQKIFFDTGQKAGKQALMMKNDLTQKARDTFDSVSRWFQKLPGRIAGFISTMWARAKKWFGQFKDNAVEWAKSTVDDVLQFFKDLPGKIADAVGGAVDAVKGRVGELAGSFKVGFEKGVEGRAHGGPVQSGRPFVVGEQGPEMFIPNTAGRIEPSAGGTVNIENINISSDADADRFLSQLRDMLGGDIEAARMGVT